jgi:BON domain
MQFDKEKQLSLAIGAGLGASLMFVLGKNSRVTHDGGENIGNNLNDIRAEILARKLPPPTDSQLERRVRSELGRHIEHGWTIDVVADDGYVTLSGNVLEDELEDAVSTARDVHGVRKVWSEMRVRDRPGNARSLQS